MNNNNFIKYAILVLLIANAIIIGMLFIGKGKNTNPPPHEGGVDFLLKTLNFTKDQQEELEKLITEHRKGIKPLRDAVKNAKKAYFENLRKQPVADSALQNDLQNIGKAMQNIDSFTYTHFAKVRLLCNPTQQKKFDEIIDEIIDKISKPGPPPPPPHHHRGEGADEDRNHPPPPNEEGEPENAINPTIKK